MNFIHIRFSLRKNIKNINSTLSSLVLKDLFVLNISLNIICSDSCDCVWVLTAVQSITFTKYWTRQMGRWTAAARSGTWRAPTLDYFQHINRCRWHSWGHSNRDQSLCVHISRPSVMSWIHLWRIGINVRSPNSSFQMWPENMFFKCFRCRWQNS